MRTGQKRLVLVGDVATPSHPSGVASMLRHVKERLLASDAVFGNLEWPLMSHPRLDPERYGRPRGFMQSEAAAQLRDAGFLVVSLANNHMMDYGVDGLEQTIRALEDAGVRYCGGGRDASEARAPALLEMDGVTAAFFAYTSVRSRHAGPVQVPELEPQISVLEVATSYEPPPRVFDQPGTPPLIRTKPDETGLERICADISRIRPQVDLVVVSFHWGVSGGYRKRAEYQETVGRRLIAAGADLVVGTHPHVFQGVERRGSGLIVYSLGDFVFWLHGPGTAPNHDPFTVLMTCEIGPEGLGAAWFEPLVFASGGEPRPADTKTASSLFDLVRSTSADLGTEVVLDAGRMVVS